MTEVVDEITIKIVLHHCRDGLAIEPLRAQVRSAFCDIARNLKPCTEGLGEYSDKISYQWKHTGLFEVPETSGGDN